MTTKDLIESINQRYISQGELPAEMLLPHKELDEICEKHDLVISSSASKDVTEAWIAERKGADLKLVEELEKLLAGNSLSPAHKMKAEIMRNAYVAQAAAYHAGGKGVGFDIPTPTRMGRGAIHFVPGPEFECDSHGIQGSDSQGDSQDEVVTSIKKETIITEETTFEYSGSEGECEEDDDRMPMAPKDLKRSMADYGRDELLAIVDELYPSE